MVSSTRRQVIPFIAAGIVMCTVHSACHKSGSSSSSISDAFPVDMAVASPTAANTEAAVQVSSLTLGELTVPLGGGSDFAEKSGPDKAEVYNQMTDPSSASSCLITLPPFQSATDPTCYGPGLFYENNPNAATPNSGTLPTGDLGLWTATEGSDLACTAAKINALSKASANYADYVMHLAAAMICSLDTTATALPDTDGESINITSALNAAIQVNNPNATVSAATLENLPAVTVDGDAHDAYKFSITAVDTTGSTVSISCQMTHVPLNASNSQFVGRLRTWITGIPNAGAGKATSVTYQRTATNFRIKLLTADYNSTSTEAQIFNSADELKIDGPWTGNLAQAFQDVNENTFLGSFSYAWQAGTGDSHARIFNGFTQLGSGCGFFGFGREFNNSTGVASDNVIDGMICNWAGPGNSHSMTTTSGLAQKQCMIPDTSTGVWEIDSTKNKITFAPTNSCNGDGTFRVSTVSSSGPWTIATTSNDLVTLASDADFANYTAPVPPTTF